MKAALQAVAAPMGAQDCSHGSPRLAMAGAPDPAGFHVGPLLLWKHTAERTPGPVRTRCGSPPPAAWHSYKGLPSCPASFLASFPSPRCSLQDRTCCTGVRQQLRPQGEPMHERDCSSSPPKEPSLLCTGGFCKLISASKNNVDLRNKIMAMCKGN